MTEARKTSTGLELYQDGIFVIEIRSLKEWESVKHKLSDRLHALAWPFVEAEFAPPISDWQVGDCVSPPDCGQTWKWPPHKYEDYCCTDLRCFKKRSCGSFKCVGPSLYHNDLEIARVEQDSVTLTIKLPHSENIRLIQLPKDSELLYQLLDRKGLSSIPAVQTFAKL